MTLHKNSLRSQANAYKLQKAKSKTARRRAQKILNKNILRAYGRNGELSLDEAKIEYQNAKSHFGMTDDHAGRFELAGVVLQPKQIEFAVAARLCDVDEGPNEIGIGGARGPGKSFAVFAQVALDDCQRFPNLKCLYLRFTGVTATEQMQDLTGAVLGNFPNKDAKVRRIDFPNGSRIIIGGFKDDNEALKYQGVEYDVTIIEEATQLKFSTYETLTLSRRSSKVFAGKRWHPRIYTTTNPMGRGHKWFRKRFVRNERLRDAGDVDYDARRLFIFATVDDNAFAGRDYIQTLDDLSGAAYRAYRLGDWDVSAGAYFEQWSHERHVVKGFEGLPDGWRVWASMDYGFNHPNVIHLHAKDLDGNCYTFDELVHRKKQVKDIVPDLKTKLGMYGLTVKDLQGFYAGGDVFNRTGNSETTVAEKYKAEGVSISRADVSGGSRIMGAILMAELLGNENNPPPRSTGR